ncbi:hypothetical protein [Synechococcus sp. CS-1328]|nr:hypothetical protein [Synechococcus sp. CS-1328]
MAPATLGPAEEQPVADDRQTRRHHQSGHLLEALDHPYERRRF